MNTSRSSIPQPYARSATDKNFNDRASSRKPNTTFTEFSQPPDFGISLSQDGKMANNVNGNARARAKPVIPIAGPTMSPDDAASTRSVPMIGPVHENDTRARVNAIKNMLRSPVVDSALLSTLVDHFDGNLMSNAPKNEIANTNNKKKNARLKIAFVASSFSLLAPNIAVIVNPKRR